MGGAVEYAAPLFGEGFTIVTLPFVPAMHCHPRTGYRPTCIHPTAASTQYSACSLPTVKATLLHLLCLLVIELILHAISSHPLTVCPHLSLGFTLAPFASSHSAASALPSQAARWRADLKEEEPAGDVMEKAPVLMPVQSMHVPVPRPCPCTQPGAAHS